MEANERAELGERIAKMEGLLENHEKNAIERKASIEKKFDAIFSKLDSQNCRVHEANMKKLQDDNTDIFCRLKFLEKAYWTGVGALTVLIFFVKFFIK